MNWSEITVWFKANWPWLSPVVLITLASIYNGVSEYPKAKSFIQWLIDIVSLTTKKDSEGSLKLPFMPSKAPKGKPNMRTGAASAWLPVLLFSSMYLMGCACWKPEGRAIKACVVVRQVVDCTTAEIKDIGPVVSKILGGLISGGATVDWDMILARLEGAGLKDAGCIIANLQNDFVSKPAASPQYAERAKMIQVGFEQWKTKHDMVSVKFKLLVDGGKTVLQ